MQEPGLDRHEWETEWAELEPYFVGAICFVEWPEAGAAWLPQPRAEVRLHHVDPTRRRIVLEGAEEALLAGLS